MSAAKASMPLADVLARWDELTVRWGLDRSEREALVGGSDHQPGAPVETYRLLCGEQRIRLVVMVAPVLLAAIGSDAGVREWLRAPSADFGGRAPLTVMSRSPEILLWFGDRAGAFS